MFNLDVILLTVGQDPSVAVFFCKTFPWILLSGWFLYSVFQIGYKSIVSPEKINYYLFESIPGVFTTFGLLGTFLGIVYGLMNFDTDPETIRESIRGLLEGLKVAFTTSITGIFLSFVFSRIVDWRLNAEPKIKPPDSEETKLLAAMLEAIRINGITHAATRQLIFDSTVKIGRNLDQFSNNIATSNADALIGALQGVIEDFNDTFKNFIESLVTKNFEELNKSVERLNTWQTNNKEHLAHLTHQFETIVEGIETTSDELGLIKKYNEQITGQNGKLAKIIVELENALVNDPRIFTNLENIAKELNSSTTNIQDASKHFQTTKEEITTWLQAEGGVHTTAMLLTEKLSELNRIEPGELEILNNGFNQRLESTFKSLDKLMMEYIKMLEEKTKRYEAQA